MSLNRLNKIHHSLDKWLRLVLLLIFISPMILLTSCGEKPSEEAKNELKKPAGLEPGCEINREELEDILEKEIPESIYCLKKNIDVFMRVIQLRPGQKKDTLSRESLATFIEETQPELKDIKKYLDLFFHMAHLIFRDDFGYISKKYLSPITEAIVIINRQFVLAYKHFRYVRYPINQDPSGKVIDQQYTNYKIDRERVVNASTNASNALLNIFVLAKPDDLPLKEVPLKITEFIDIFKNKKNEDDLEKIKNLLFIKSIVSGGNSNSINQAELLVLIRKLPELVYLASDATRANSIDFDNEIGDVNKFELIRDAIKVLNSVLYYKDRPQQFIFSSSELKNALIVYKNEIHEDIENYFDLIPELKAIYANSARPDFIQADLNKLLKNAYYVIEQVLGVARLYLENKNIVQVKTELTPEMIRSLTNNSNLKQYDNFVNIVSKYRFFKGQNPIPVFSGSYERNLRAIIQISIVEGLYKILANYYEQTYPCDKKEFFVFPRPMRRNCSSADFDPVNGICTENLTCTKKDLNGNRVLDKEDYNFTMTQGQLEHLVRRIVVPLTKLDIATPGREYMAAENATLLTDLFQFQSNTNGLVDVVEAAEFGMQIFSAVAMKTNVVKGIEQFCPPMDVGRPTKYYEASCMRNHFFNVLNLQFAYPKELESKGTFAYMDFLTSMNAFYQNRGVKEKNKFIMEMENFTRTCYSYKENAPIPQTDIVAVFGGIFNVEATLLKFDISPTNGFLEGEELDKAYFHYRGVIDGILEKSLKKKYEKIIVNIIGRKRIVEAAFYYLIKKAKLPEGAAFVVFALGKYKKDAQADRFTIANVLTTIKQQSPNKPDPVELEKVCFSNN